MSKRYCPVHGYQRNPVLDWRPNGASMKAFQVCRECRADTTDTPPEFQRKPFVYLASPYTHDDPEVMNQRAVEMQEFVAGLINSQTDFIPYSPIAYTHEIAPYVKRDFDWYSWDFTIPCSV